MVRAPGRVTHIPPLSGFETRHGLMPLNCLSLWQKYNMHVDIIMLLVYFGYE